jgi:hypothetical protein
MNKMFNINLNLTADELAAIVIALESRTEKLDGLSISNELNIQERRSASMLADYSRVALEKVNRCKLMSTSVSVSINPDLKQ